MRPTFLIVDLFCGAGGTTTGFEMTGGIAKVIACVNHDAKAIESHWMNHPTVQHFNEDIRTLHLGGLKKVVKHYRGIYPEARLILWASLECTNFSKAKGGMPRDADSRTLADELFRYERALQPDYIMIENVVEFMSWGPLDENGKPVSRRNGEDWIRWCNTMCAIGYRQDWNELNSANFGAYTSRNRLFGIFARPDLPIVWPEATHAKNPTKGSMYNDNLQKWKAVKEVLDFSDEGESIFGRKKPLSEKTLERIYAGLVKYIAGGKDQHAYMLKYNSTDKSGKHYPPSIDEPSPVLTTQDRLGLVQPAFLAKYFSGRPEGKVTSVEAPAGTITTFGNQQLVQASFITQRNNGDPNSKVVDVNGPARTLTATGGNQDLVQPQFLSHYYGTGGIHSSLFAPAPTIPTKARTALVSAVPFIERAFSGGGQHSSVEQPAGSLLSVPKMNLVTPVPFVMHTAFSNLPSSIETPHPTLTATRRHSYLVNPAWGGNNGSVEDPCCVVVARQDKAPLYLVQTEEGQLAIQLFDTDSPCTIKIKQFMAMYGIVDIRMRMLKVAELLRIQGFPEGYRLSGNQTDQKKFIGNSVVPHVVQAWALALAAKFNDQTKAA